MLQIKNTLGGGKPEGLYAWEKNEIWRELKELNESAGALPYDFYNGSAVVLNGEIHILGGNYEPTKHYKWDGSSWTSVSTLPYNFYQGSAVVLNGEIHIFGGYATGVGLNHYKWDGTSWTSVSTLPYAFHVGGTVVLNNEIHILGGNGNTTKHYKWDGNSWTEVSTLPYDFQDGSVVIYNNEIHIFGSSYNSTYYIYHYKWNGTSWTSVSTLPYGFRRGSAVVFENEIHILGTDNSSAYYKAHYKFDGTSWTSVGTLPYDFYQGSAVVYSEGVRILGSSNSSYRTKHYLVYGYVPAYIFLDYVVSDKETAYPDGGEKGGYYYEKVLDAKIATGTLSVSRLTSLTIDHGLSVKPTKFILWATFLNGDDYQNGAYFSVDNDNINAGYTSLNDGSILTATGTKETTIINDTQIIIPMIKGSEYNSNYLYWNGNYNWIAIAE